MTQATDRFNRVITKRRTSNCGGAWNEVLVRPLFG